MDTDYQSAVRKPPHALEAEQRVIGALLIDPDALDAISDLLMATDFFDRRHQQIFQAIMALAEALQPIDTVTVCEWLNNQGRLADIGGMQYPVNLANEATSSASIRAYAQIVRDKAAIRDLIRATTDTLEMAYQPEDRDAQTLIDEAQARIFALTEGRNHAGSSFIAAKDALQETIDHIETISKDKNVVTGLPTGYEDLDRQTSGLHPGQLVIIAGRPSMGKTAFAMNIAENVSCDQKKTVAVFSMEMPVHELMIRALSSQSRVSQSRLRNGNLQPSDWGRLASGAVRMSESRMYIDASPALSPMDLRSRARKLKKEEGLDLIVVDYLQLMQVPGGSGNRVGEISEISRSLKSLAKELSVPVIALSQLNRGLENRTDKRPMMSDLRESGAIEQDADLILFLYREEVYKKDSEEVKGVAEVIIGKQRNGPVGTVRMTFNGEYTRFDNYAPETGFGSSHTF
ncbi:MAG: replicative DNA helicase [Acidithiobacillus sp.]